MFRKLRKSVDKLNNILQEKNIQQLIYILGSKKEIMKRNLIAGISRGVGIGIGVTLMTAILIILLRKIVALNIPIIGKFIADIVEIVENNK